MRRGTFVLAVLAQLGIVSIALAQQPRGFFGGGGFQVTSAVLLRIPEVKKELGTSDEQNKQIDEVVEEAQEQLRGSFGNFRELQKLGEEERRKKFQEAREKAEAANKKADEKLSKILDSKQVDRLKQLRLQREGSTAFSRPEIVKELALSEDQLQKIRKIQEDSRPQGGAGDFQNLSDEERRKRFTEFRERREKAQTDILAVLTTEQKTKFDELKGKEFTFPALPGRR